MSNDAKPVHMILSYVQMRRPGISDLVRNNGTKFKVQWVIDGTGVITDTDIVYTSTAKGTREAAEKLARTWLAKNPQFVEAK